MTTTILRSDDLACPTCVAGLETMLRPPGEWKAPRCILRVDASKSATIRNASAPPYW